jgi:hypothetical protein
MIDFGIFGFSAMSKSTTPPESQEQALRTARAHAIEAYARIESELCYVLSALLGTRHDTASIVFFKITSARARNDIIVDLLEHIHQDQFDLYWHGQPGGGSKKRVPGMLTLLNQLDQRRNEIVHWHIVGNSFAGPDGQLKRWDDLRPAFFWARSNATPISESELREFSVKADFVERSLSVFWKFVRHPQKFKPAELAIWQQMFQQPATYPPSKDHPLYQNPKAL